MAIENHPKYSTLKTLVDSLILKVRNKQAEYFAAKKKYFQGLLIPSTGKLDGSLSNKINYGLHPSDQEDSWNSFDSANFNVSTKLPIHIKIDVYQSPDGWGWILGCEFWLAGLGPDRYGRDGDHWCYRHNEGPEMGQGIWDEWFIVGEETV